MVILGTLPSQHLHLKVQAISVCDVIYLTIVSMEAIAEKAKWEAISKRTTESVGRVFFGTECVGSCVALSLHSGVYIITCRHVAFDEDSRHIPLYHLMFTFNKRAYTASDFVYRGSNKSLDLCFFLLRNSLARAFCFSINPDQFLYQGMGIVVAGFPAALDEMDYARGPKFNSGRVSAGGINEDLAVSDVSSTLPNMSGGAVFSTIGEGECLLGIHLGAHYHEDNSYKLVDAVEEEEEEEEEDVGTLTELTLDDLCLRAPVADAETATESLGVIISSPPTNTRTRSIYGEQNVKHKGSMSYFCTVAPIRRLLEKKALLKAGAMQQSRKRKGSKALKK